MEIIATPTTKKRDEILKAGSIRSRRSRERRKDGTRCVTIEVRDEELAALVRKGLLDGATRCDLGAIRNAIYNHFDRTLA